MHALTPSATRITQPTVLAIEDNEDNLIYLASALELFKYNCLTARDAVSGLSLAEQWQPDLILLDVKMPHISGIELVKTLKLNLLTKAIPVIAVTALASQKQKKLILAAGFSDYLLKPYLLEELAAIICSHIANSAFG